MIGKHFPASRRTPLRKRDGASQTLLLPQQVNAQDWFTCGLFCGTTITASPVVNALPPSTHTMSTVLFINCTRKTSPEISNTEALWQPVAALYQQSGWQIRTLRVVDYEIPVSRWQGNPGDEFPQVFEQILQADILVVGVPLARGNRSSECQKLLERLQTTAQTHVDPETGCSSLYGKVFGLVAVSDGYGGGACIAQLHHDFNQLGYVNPPDSTVVWVQPMDTAEEFIEAEGKYAVSVNRAARLLVDNTVAIATLLQQTPLSPNLRQAAQTAQAIAKAATVETGTFIAPRPIRAEESPVEGSSDGIDYHHVTKRIWTVMQAGMRLGFTFKIVSLADRTFRAERDGKGFTYKIYPGHYSFRSQYRDYDAEQFKSRKLDLMDKHGLPVPIAYGTYQTFAEIPIEQLTFPVVAKPNSGSLSENVFTNLQTEAQLRQAVTEIEAAGGIIKLESHVTGWDFRVLILNHQYAGCVQRRPARVVGDGHHTIRELFHLRNQEPGRGDRFEAHTTIHQIVFDDTSRRLLQKSGYTLDTILPVGEIFYLQEKITAATGSDYVDMTNQLHPSIIQSCIDFSHQFSTLTLGFDLITTDVSKALTETGGAFNEYNFLPYVDLHENCNIGQKRSVCHLIWEYIEAHQDQIVTTKFNPF